MNKRVAVFTPYLSKSRGGIENLSFNLVKQLREYIEVTAYSGRVRQEEKLENTYYSKYNDSQLKVGCDLLHQVYKDFRDNKSDFNIALTWKVGVISYLVNKLYNIPYAVYIHGNDIYPNTKNRVEKLIISKVLENAQVVIANSKYTQKLGINYGNFNIKVIHPGISYKRINSNNVKNNKQEKILFTVARLEKRKGIGNTLRALPQVIDTYPEIHYYIAGTGSYAGELQKIVQENNLEQHVTFTGFVSEEKKIELYKKCDLFVMPSYELKQAGSVEGFGIVYLEANMFGKFVIAGKAGGTADAVQEGKTGFRVDGTKPTEIGTAIINFYDSYYKNIDYQADCREWAQSHSWNQIIKQVLEVIEL